VSHGGGARWQKATPFSSPKTATPTPRQASFVQESIAQLKKQTASRAAALRSTVQRRRMPLDDREATVRILEDAAIRNLGAAETRLVECHDSATLTPR
jgi:hypothetical protein